MVCVCVCVFRNINTDSTLTIREIEQTNFKIDEVKQRHTDRLH